MAIAATAMIVPAAPPAASTADSRTGTCRAALPIDAASPLVDRRVARGVRLLMWEAQHRDTRPGETSTVRVAAVALAPGAASIAPVTSGYPRATDPRTVAYREGVVATTNGDFFDILDSGGELPVGAVVRNGEASFAPPGWSRSVVVAPSGRLRSTGVRLAGRLIGTKVRLRIDAVNTPLAAPRATVAYTPDWKGPRIVASALVIVRNGTISRVTRDGARVRVPGDGYVIAVGSGSVPPALRAGGRAIVDLGVRARDGGRILHASGSGGLSLSGGRLTGSCSAYEGILRPRTAIAWARDGRIWFLTATSGGPDPADGIRRGGATKRQLAQVARALGASEVAVMDGGGSTALFTRSGATPQRQDLPDSAWTRPVPVVWAARLPGR